jgi:NarL family two-component system response regulator LiaR
MATAPAATIRLLLVGSHALTRAALRCLLLSGPNHIAVVGEGDRVADALDAADGPVDLILLEVNRSSDYSRTLREAVAAARSRPVLVVTDDATSQVSSRAIQLGAMGVVLKSETPETLVKAIQKTHAGEVWLRRSQAAEALRFARLEAPQSDRAAEKIASLTRREREIIDLIAEGLPNRTIAERLFISEATVRNHLTSILDKLELRNRFELVVFAFRRGLAEC